MEESITSGSFGKMEDSFSKFHDYRQLPYCGAGYSVLYSVLSGERKLFLKALNKEQGALAENLARLQREYKILERLYGNEHIVRCIGWREDTEVGPCIVMEYIDGEPLTDYLKTNPSNKEKKRILNELLDALAFIHKYQIVHNDLKPENILITRNGHNVKLIDFGYADGDSNIDKATGGTKAFASPELVRQETTDVTSDIYSLGFIIKALFPLRYGSVVRKCQYEETENRYQRVSEVGNAIGWRDHVKWFVLALLVVFVALLTWPMKEPEEVMEPEQTESVSQNNTVTDTLVVIQEHRDTIVLAQFKPENKDTHRISVEHAERSKPNLETVVNNAAEAMNLDSIHQVYQSIYKKCKDAITTGIADSSLKYMEFARFHLYDFSNGMKEKYIEMWPEDEELQRVFLNDYTTEYERFLTRLEGLCAPLPSFYQAVNDDALLSELKAAYKTRLDKQMENLQRLNEMSRQKFQEN